MRIRLERDFSHLAGRIHMGQVKAALPLIIQTKVVSLESGKGIVRVEVVGREPGEDDLIGLKVDLLEARVVDFAVLGTAPAATVEGYRAMGSEDGGAIVSDMQLVHVVFMRRHGCYVVLDVVVLVNHDARAAAVMGIGPKGEMGLPVDGLGL